jgi:sialic acid synthase SpsE
MRRVRKMRTIYIGKVPVGDDHPPVFVAEVGSFFNKDVELALDFLARTVEAGAPVFKTEILHDPNTVLGSVDLDCRYNYAGGEKVESYRSLIERKVVPLEGYRRLLTAANDMSIPVIATVFDDYGIDFLKDMGGSGIKISRNNLHHVPLLRKAGKSGLPVIMDTGEVHLSEISKAVEILHNLGADAIVNHHPGPNPAPAGIHNMRMIDTYKSMFHMPIGLACHYRGDEMLYVAVACGANLLEKGVVDDPYKEEVDLVSALPFSELGKVLVKVKRCWESLGDGLLRVPENRNLSIRTGMYARKNFKKGEKISLETVGFAWPPVGASPENWDEIEGWVVNEGIAEGEPIPLTALSAKVR